MASSTKSRSRRKSRARRVHSRNYWWRIAVAALWCAVIVVLLFFVGRWTWNRFIASRQPLAPADTVADSLTQVILPHGARGQLVRYSAFKVIYNTERHVPWCVAYVLTASHTRGQIDRVGSFEQDTAVVGCASPADYVGSGYERGHMAPAADMRWSELAMAESFMMTNVCPQCKALNEGGWGDLEDKVREWARRDGTLVVITGPVLTAHDATISAPGSTRRIAVPGRYFKVLLAPDATPRRAIGFLYPNGRAGGLLSDYAVSVDEVERLTGLDFFTALPSDEEQDLESHCNLAAWLQTTR